MKIFRLSMFLWAHVCPTTLFAQVNYSDDSIVYRTAVENARNKSIRIQRAINIGSEYNESLHLIRNGHQYFLSNEKIKGEIVYNDVLYKNLSLQYDLVQDEVIAEHVNGKKIILVKERVTEFIIGGHVFRRLPDFEASDKIKPGFFEVLVDGGDVKLLAKRRKLIKGKSAAYFTYKMENSRVEDDTKYYLIKDNNLFYVKNHKSIAEILSDKKRDSTIRLTTKEKSKEVRMINIVKQYADL